MSRRRRLATPRVRPDATDIAVAQAHQVQLATGQTGHPARIFKAGIEGGGLGTAAIGSRISLEQTSWQQTLLVDAGLQYWLYSKDPTLRAIIDRTAGACATDDYTIDMTDAPGMLPLDVDDKGGAGTDEIQPGDSTTDPDDPQYQALKTVLNGIASGRPLSTLLAGVFRDLLINANAYLRIMRAGKKPAALKRLDFRFVAPNLDPETGERRWYDLFHGGNFRLAPDQIPLEDIIHIQDNDLGPGGCGLSKIESLDSMLALKMSAIGINTGYMQNGTKSGDVYRFGPTMSEDKIERERLYIQENFSKPSQSYMPMFLAGDIELVKEGAAGRRDADFLALLDLVTEDTASVYHMPLSLLSRDKVGPLGGNGREQDLVMWNNDVVSPMQRLVYLSLTYDLLKRTLNVTKYVLDAPKGAALRLELVEIAKGMIQSGATGNEGRSVLNLPEMSGLDVPLFFMGKSAAFVGAPGTPESGVLTPNGMVSGEIQDAQQLASAGASPASQTVPVAPSAEPEEEVEEPVTKARNGTVTVSGAPPKGSVERVRRGYNRWADQQRDLKRLR